MADSVYDRMGEKTDARRREKVLFEGRGEVESKTEAATEMICEKHGVQRYKLFCVTAAALHGVVQPRARFETGCTIPAYCALGGLHRAIVRL